MGKKKTGAHPGEISNICRDVRARILKTRSRRWNIWTPYFQGWFSRMKFRALWEQKGKSNEISLGAHFFFLQLLFELNIIRCVFHIKFSLSDTCIFVYIIARSSRCESDRDRYRSHEEKKNSQTEYNDLLRFAAQFTAMIFVRLNIPVIHRRPDFQGNVRLTRIKFISGAYRVARRGVGRG